MSNVSRREALKMIGAVGMAAVAVGAAAASGPSTSTGVIEKPIPPSGEKLPVIGLGTWQTFDVGSDPAARAALQQVLAEFVKLGGKVLDSSPMYGSSEEVAGDLAAKLGVRARLFVATKVWTKAKRAGVEQMEASLRKLRADPIDLMQVHNLVDVDAHLETLAEWKKAGRVRYVGVTHYTAGGAEAVAKLIEGRKDPRPFDFVQINYSVGERDAEKRLLPLAKERGIAVIANRPFAGGELLRRLTKSPMPDFARQIDCDSWPQLLLKFVVSHPAITVAIPATNKLSHLQDNMKAQIGRLPDEPLRARIAAAATSA